MLKINYGLVITLMLRHIKSHVFLQNLENAHFITSFQFRDVSVEIQTTKYNAKFRFINNVMK